MKLKTIVSAVAIAAASVSAQAGPLLSEGFNSVSGLPASGWAQVPTSGSPGSGWFQGNTGIFSAASGPADSYAAANFVDGPATISDWLFTPVLAFSGIVYLNFDLRLLGQGLLDTVEVYASSAGSSTAAGDFNLLGTFSASDDTGWVTRGLAFGGGGDGRIGFRYFVGDTRIDGNYVGLDNVTVAVPEPGSLALAGLALAGLVTLRRRAA